MARRTFEDGLSVPGLVLMVPVNSTDVGPGAGTEKEGGPTPGFPTPTLISIT